MSTETPDLVAALDATDPTAQDGDDVTTGVHTTDVDDSADDGADELGDKGKQALDRMKARLKAEKAARLALEARLNETSAADDVERIQREADAKAAAKANARILSAEVRAAAAGKLSDPSDALTFIDLTQFDVDDDGSVDQDEIAEAIADLVRRKPYLAAQGGPKSPKPDPSQGEGGRGAATAADRFAQQVGNLI